MENLQHLASKVYDAQNDETRVVKLLLEQSESLLIKLDSHSEVNETNFQEINDRLKYLETVIKGINGENGLQRKSKERSTRIKKLEDDYKILITKITIYIAMFNLLVAPAIIWGVQQLIKHLFP